MERSGEQRAGPGPFPVPGGAAPFRPRSALQLPAAPARPEAAGVGGQG